MNYTDCTHMPNGMLARGCLPRDTRLGAEQPIFEDTYAIYPRSDWPDLIRQNQSLRSLVLKIKDQKQEGSCASNATTQVLQVCWLQTFGFRAFVEFSPISIYRWVANSPNDGSTIDGNLRQLKEVGALPVRNTDSQGKLAIMGLPVGHVLEPTGYYQDFPSDWKSTAAFFQGIESLDIGSFDGMVSASLDGFAIVYGRAGHAICGVSPYQDGSKYGIDYANSWGNWGDEGFGKDTESFISRAISSYGAWALRSVKVTDEALNLAIPV